MFKCGRRDSHECRPLEPVAILCRKSVVNTDFGRAAIHCAFVSPEGSSLELVIENCSPNNGVHKPTPIAVRRMND